MNIINNLENNSKEFPNKIAIIFEDQKISYKELYDKVKKISLKINNFDEEIISLVSENSISFIIMYLGIIKSGRTVHIIPPEISETNFNNQIKSADSQTIICSENAFDKILKFTKINIPILKITELEEQLESEENNFKENQIAHLIFTSGTTSTPKGAGITHNMLNFTTKNIIDVLGYLISDIDILPLPLYHSFGLGCIYTSLTVGSTIILHKDASNIENLLNSIKKYNATTFSAIPATLIKILKFENFDLTNCFSNIRLIITNSTAIPKTTVQKYKEILKKGNLATYYGLTEASRSTFMIFEKSSSRDESVGKSAPGVSIKIENEEIWIKGKNVISKYWNNTIADESIKNGWLKTGDVGFLDDENYLFLKGRKDDIINIGGEKVLPIEIEEVVKQIPDVIDAVAFGIKNEIFGQVIKLNIVKSNESNLDKGKILIYCMKNLEKFKIPNKIDFVEKIPKTSYGKVKRFMLK